MSFFCTWFSSTQFDQLDSACKKHEVLTWPKLFRTFFLHLPMTESWVCGITS